MELSNYSKIKIKDICTWERSKKGKVYPAGCWCVQVSATKGTNGICGRATGSRI